jgi:hypothetical protein
MHVRPGWPERRNVAHSDRVGSGVFRRAHTSLEMTSPRPSNLPSREIEVTDK